MITAFSINPDPLLTKILFIMRLGVTQKETLIFSTSLPSFTIIKIYNQNNIITQKSFNQIFYIGLEQNS
jgi:hypothetical protein